MGKQEQVNRKDQTAKQTTEETEEVAAVDLTNEELGEDVDAILDEIDDVLEENAEEFVLNYKQKGGQ